jgi:hypothetical protein
MHSALMLIVLALMVTSMLPGLTHPVDLQIDHDGNSVTLSWNPVPGATAYRVYVSDDPYGTYLLDNGGTWSGSTSWTIAESSSKKFYEVTAIGGQSPVELGMAGNYVILAETGISTIPNSAITGDIAVSPNTAASITGFSLNMHSSGVYATSTQVTGRVYAADYAVPTPTNLNTAVGDMLTAYNDAAGRVNPDYLNLGSGDISGLTLSPGLYKWGTGLSVNADVTLAGGPDDVWIFQIGEGITMGPGVSVTLSGGALPKNIFWQAAGVVALNTTSHLEGIVLSQSAITLATGASVNGRLLAQTAVTLDQSTIVEPTR